MGNTRRNNILNILANTSEAISASKLADKFNVSRQAIVGDIALLRAAGHPIKATTKGYVMFKEDNRFIAKIAVDHKEERTQEELELLIKLGTYIIDVTVDHPIYGEITGQLDIRDEEDIYKFMEKVNNKEVELLSSLTRGVHLHTISCEDQSHYEEVIKALEKNNFLVNNN